VTEVVIGAVVVVVSHLTALASLWLRLSMQLRAEQVRRETLVMLANCYLVSAHESDLCYSPPRGAWLKR
jgi:hypothetical protein